MPFVRIDAQRTDPERLDALGRAVHEAMVATIDIPPNDHFQVLAGHGGMLRYDDYLGAHHDDGSVFVSITLRSGRRPEQKRALYRQIVERAQEYAGVEPRNVVIVLTENEPIDWSFGDGVAQYDSA